MRLLGATAATAWHRSPMSITRATSIDQFWWHYSFGNVRERKFSEIWWIVGPLMAGLKDRAVLTAVAQCKWFDICNANFRVRAESVYNDIGRRTRRYLTDEEIGIIAD